MEMEGTIDEIHHTIHAHPTLSEALMEAAAATHGQRSISEIGVR